MSDAPDELAEVSVEMEPVPPSEIVINTQAATIKIVGPQATTRAAFALWKRVRAELVGENRLESTGMGFSAEIGGGTGEEEV